VGGFSELELWITREHVPQETRVKLISQEALRSPFQRLLKLSTASRRVWVCVSITTMCSLRMFTLTVTTVDRSQTST